MNTNTTFTWWWCCGLTALSWCFNYMGWAMQKHVLGSLIRPSLSTNRIIGYYRIYESRAKAQMLLCAWAGDVNLCILRMFKGTFSFDVTHIRLAFLMYFLEQTKNKTTKWFSFNQQQQKIVSITAEIVKYNNSNIITFNLFCTLFQQAYSTHISLMTYIIYCQHCLGKFSRWHIDSFFVFLFFPEICSLTFHANRLLRGQFACMLNLFSQKNILKCFLVNSLPSILLKH